MFWMLVTVSLSMLKPRNVCLVADSKRTCIYSNSEQLIIKIILVRENFIISYVLSSVSAYPFYLWVQDDESFVLPVLIRFQGHPEVDDQVHIFLLIYCS